MQAQAAPQLDSAVDNLPLAAEFQIFTNGTRVIYSDFEHVNVAGTDAFDDLAVYQYGLVTLGGERVGDADLLIANFDGETEDLILGTSDRTGAGQVPGQGTDVFSDDGTAFEGNFNTLMDIGNGTYVGGFERLNVRMGSGDDTVYGGELADHIVGGDGDDTLFAGTGGTPGERDVLDGGAGDDELNYFGDNADMIGGTGEDVLNFLADVDAFTVTLLDGNRNQIGSPYIAGSGIGATTDRASLTTLYSNSPAFIDYRYDHSQGSTFISDIEYVTIEGSDFADFLMAPLRQGALFGGDGDDVLVTGLGQDLLFGGAGFDTYTYANGHGQKLIAGETLNGGRIYFNDLNRADVDFSVQNGVDLKISGVPGKGVDITIRDYFAEGGNGLDFTFDFLDQTGSIDLSGLPGIAPAGPPAAAPVYGLNLLGTSGADDFSGQFTDDRDTYRGLEGDDLFEASLGADLYIGGPGLDLVSFVNAPTGISADLRVGSSGYAAGDIYVSIEGFAGSEFNDQLYGNDFGNTFFGYLGNDLIEGNGGNDLLIGDEGMDVLRGGDDDDMLFGDEGDDDLFGGAGNDDLSGGIGDDDLLGGGGDDTLRGGAGDDDLYGGDDDDILVYGAGDDPDTPPAGGAGNEAGDDLFDGGAGTDMADLSRFGFAIEAYLTAGISGIQTLYLPTTPASPSYDQIIDLQNMEQVRGTAFDDKFIFSGGDFDADGGQGNDLFLIGAGANEVVGGGGYDTLDYSYYGGTQGVLIDLAGTTLASPYQVVDQNGDTDFAIEIEHFIGTSFVDTFIGDGFANEFTDGDGADTFYGGDGDDIVRAGVSATGFNDSYFGGAGFDTIDYSAATGDIDISLDLNTANDLAATAIGSDIVDGFEGAISGSGDDEVYGTTANNVIKTGAGNDEAYGFEGDDWFIGGTGDDEYHAGGFGTAPGFDVIDYSELSGGVTVDLNVSFATGTVVGSDTLFDFLGVAGTRDDDALFGTADDNTLYYIAIAGEGGHDQLNGRDGYDTADFSMFGAAVQYDIATQQVFTRDAGNLDLAAGPLRQIADLVNIEAVTLTRFADEILGSAGADSVSGLQGNDILTGFEGDDYLRGGEGADTVDYSKELGGLPVFVDFTTAAGPNLFQTVDTYGDVDTLELIENVIGTAGGDVMLGFENHVFDGRDGDDVLSAVTGSNLLIGGAGFDEIDGGAGLDVIFGGLDDDLIRGNGGDDAIDGGDGTDVAIYNGNFADYTIDYSFFASDGFIIVSHLDGAGADGTDTVENVERLEFADRQGSLAAFVSPPQTLIGTPNADLLIGGDGDDTIEGREDDDQLRGQNGFDLIMGEGGNDILRGGFGNDTIYGGHGQDRILGDGDNDTIEGGASNDNINGGDGDDEIYGGTENDIVVGDAGDDTLYGDQGDDTLRGRTGMDLIYGGIGDDDITGEDDNDTLYGGEGNDAMKGNAGADMVYGGAGIDTIDGGAGDDDIYGGDDRDRLFGSEGDDDIFGGGGDELVYAGTGEDEVHGGTGEDFLLGGDDNDTLYGEEDDDALVGNSGDDTLYGGDGFDRLRGHLGNDTLYGGLVGDSLTGEDGNDMLFGEEGDDNIKGNDGDDTAWGGIGADAIDGGADNDTLYGGDGNDRLFGVSGNDMLYGGIGDDQLYAGLQDDLLDGGAGTDILRGDFGDDTFIASTGDDLILGDDGFDLVDYSAGVSGLTVSLNNGSTQLIDGAGLGTHRISSIEGLIAPDFDSVLTGDDADNYLEGGAGNDTLTGAAGDDTFGWSGGTDSYDGGAGFDTLMIDAITDAITDLSDIVAVASDIEMINMNGTQNVNALWIEDAATVAALSSTTDELVVRGSVGERLLLGRGFAADQVDIDLFGDGILYDSYVSGGSTVWSSSGVFVSTGIAGVITDPTGSAMGQIAVGVGPDEPDPLLSEYWIFAADAGDQVTLSANRLEDEVDLKMYLFAGAVTDSAGQFGAEIDSSDPNYLGTGDDEIAHPGPFGDPEITANAPYTALYTAIVTHYGATANDGGDGFYDYTFDLVTL